MKKLLSGLFIVLLCFGTAGAVTLSPGLQEFGVSGTLDLDAVDDFQMDLDINYGFFIMDNLEVGAKGGLSASDHYLNFSAGPFAEYHFVISENLVPFVGLGAGFIYGKLDDTISGSNLDGSALNLEGTVGIKYFINENVAITGGFDLNWASSDVFAKSADELKATATTITIGTRFYF